MDEAGERSALVVDGLTWAHAREPGLAPGEELPELVVRADRAMYEARRARSGDLTG